MCRVDSDDRDDDWLRSPSLAMPGTGPGIVIAVASQRDRSVGLGDHLLTGLPSSFLSPIPRRVSNPRRRSTVTGITLAGIGRAPGSRQQARNVERCPKFRPYVTGARTVRVRSPLASTQPASDILAGVL